LFVFDPIAVPGLPFPAALPIPFVRVIEGFLSRADCGELRRRIDALGPAAAPITTGRGSVMRPELRNNDRVLFEDPALAESRCSSTSTRIARAVRRLCSTGT
jgi:hypothetical protein